MTTRKPNEDEVAATTLGRLVAIDGWYCPNHPPGESLANEEAAAHCWGCGAPRESGGVAPEPMVAVRETPEEAFRDLMIHGEGVFRVKR